MMPVFFQSITLKGLRIAKQLNPAIEIHLHACPSVRFDLWGITFPTVFPRGFARNDLLRLSSVNFFLSKVFIAETYNRAMVVF